MAQRKQCTSWLKYAKFLNLISQLIIIMIIIIIITIIISSSTDFLVQLLQATHPFSAESEKELSFSKGDFVVVRKVCIKSANCCVLLSLSSRNLLD